MFFPNFLTFTLETPTLFRQQKNWRHRRKRRLTSTFSYQLCSRRKTNFSNIKGVQRTYVTVANQSTVHRTNPTEEIQYQRTAAQTTVASPTNNSFRTNTFVRRQPQLLYFSNFSAWSENIIGRNQSLFLQTRFCKHQTVFTEPPTKKYLHFANFQKAGQPLKEVSLDRQNSK